MHLTLRLALFALVLLVPASSSAQTITAAIAGVVKDSTGGVLPGVTVTFTHLQSERKVTAVTDRDGRYQSVPLQLGDYRVEAGLEGFKSAARTGVALTLDETARVDFVLEVGALSEVVQVNEAARAIESTTSTLAKLVDNRRIAELPLNTRNVYSLIYLTPGVAGTIGNSYGDLRYTVNGARPRTNDVLVDGVTGSFPTVNGGSGISVFPSVDAIQEFKVIGANYPAEFGRSLGGVLNVVYKSGGNQFHGSSFEFLRDSSFDANDFFANRRGDKLGDFSRHQFGGMAGGPIQTSRMFYMVSYEGLRQDSFSSRTFTVPTQLQRQGDFSQTFAANGQLVRIFNPFTTRANPAGSGFIRDQFTGNIIPKELWDPVALNVLKYYPLPNQPGDPVTGLNNYSKTGTRLLNVDNIDLRVDRNVSQRGRGFVRYSFRTTEDVPAQTFPDDAAIAEGRVIEENHVHNFVAEYNHSLSPTSLLTARIGFARTLFVFNNQGLGFKPSSLGLPASIDAAVDREMFPAIGASGFVGLGGNDHRYNAFMSYPVLFGYTKSTTKHTLKAGFDGRMLRVNVWEARAAGTFNFSAGMTQGPNPSTASSTAGNAIASLLLGTGTTGNVLIQNWKNVASQSFYLAGYVQDDWRLTSKLTFNAGLRYDFDTPRTERYNRMNYFDPAARSPLADRVAAFPNLAGGLVFVGVDGNNRWQFTPDKNNLAPRLGAAYLLNEKTVLRAGYAHVYGPSAQAAQGTIGPFGFRTENLWVSTVDSITPFNLLRNPYPAGFQPSPGAADGLLTGVGGGIQGVLHDQTPTPWNRQWNVTIQREIPWNTTLEIAYVGTRGYDLSTNGEGGRNLNQLDPKYMALGAELNQQVDNPFFGIVNNGVLASARVSRAHLLRPFPQFTDVIPLFPSGSTTSYDALQISWNKRMSAGLLVAGSYAYSKAMETGENHQNSYDIEASNAIASYDIPHRFVTSVLYELPVGHGRRFGSKWHGVVDGVLGGWQINGIVTVQSGAPLSISASNTSGIFGALTRPNWNGADPVLDGARQARLQRWFDTSVFSQPAPFTFGNLSAALGRLRADGVRNVDLSLFKHFAVVGRARLQARVEAFNAFNRAQFSGPNTSVTSGSFGIVSSQANTPRQLQFGVKMLW
jgi:hypothetical protein